MLRKLDQIVSSLHIQPEITSGEIVTIIILFLTLFVGAVYTFLTYRLWKEANLQSRLAVSPFIIVDIDSTAKILVKNIGKSPAFDIQMESFAFLLSHLKGKGVDKFTLLFARLNLLDAASTEELHFKTLMNGKLSQGFDLSPHVNNRVQRTRLWINP